MKVRFSTYREGTKLSYPGIMFICPGCELEGSGVHILPVNNDVKAPSWDWNGDVEKPTLSPSILTKHDNFVCHSFLTDGVFHFLSDSTHALAGKSVPIPDLPHWLL